MGMFPLTLLLFSFVFRLFGCASYRLRKKEKKLAHTCLTLAMCGLSVAVGGGSSTWTGFPINTHLAPSSPIRPSKSLFDMTINSAHRALRFDAQFSRPFDGLMSITKH